MAGPTPERVTPQERAADGSFAEVERKFQRYARQRARTRGRGRLRYVPEGSYWVSFRDKDDEEIYGFWLQRQRAYRVTDSSDDTFAVKSFKERRETQKDRDMYFEAGQDALAYPFNMQSTGSSPTQWLRAQMRNIKMSAGWLESRTDASNWVFVDDEFDEEYHLSDAHGDYKRKILRLRIPATEIHTIVICKYRPEPTAGGQFDKCGQFPEGGISLSQWIDGEGDPLSRRFLRR